MLIIAKELLNTSPEKELELDRLTVEEWLTKHGQSAISRKYIWDVITIGALNNYPKNVSALLLFRVLRAAFLGNRDNSSLLIPRVGLSELFVNPAVEFIKTRGGEVYTGIGVKIAVVEGTHVRSVRTSDGKEFHAKSFVCAVPWYSFEDILPPRYHKSKFAAGQKSEIRFKESFTSSPIVSINLWLDREITDLDFAPAPMPRGPKPFISVCPSDNCAVSGPLTLKYMKSSDRVQSHVAIGVEAGRDCSADAR